MTKTSTNQRVNGRGHRTLSDKATCTCCEQTYNNWKYIAPDGKCYECHGYTLSNVVEFIKKNAQ